MKSVQVEQLIAELSKVYPQLITYAQAAKIANKAVSTIRDFSHRGFFDEFRSGKGSGTRLILASFVRWLFQEQLHNEPADSVGSRA